MQADEAYNEWAKSPTPGNMSSVVKALEPTIGKEVYKYQGPREVLKSKAKTLAVKSVKSYDPARGAALSTWVVNNLKPLSRYAANTSIVRTPEVARQRAAELHKNIRDFESESGREPDDTELADRTGMSVTKVRELRYRVPMTRSESMLSATASEDADVDLPATSEGVSPSYSFEVVLESLNPRERAIAELKTGRRGGVAVSNKQIAQRLGVSEAYISQVSARIANKVQEVQRAI